MEHQITEDTMSRIRNENDPSVDPRGVNNTSEIVETTTTEEVRTTSAPLGAGVPGTVIGGTGIGSSGMSNTDALGMGVSPTAAGMAPAGGVSNMDYTDEEHEHGHGHNIVTGEEAHTGAGKAGLGTGAIVGGLIGTAVGGPVGAIVGGAIGSLLGGVAGDATEEAEGGTVSGVGLGGTGMGTGVTERAGDAMTGTPVPGTVIGHDLSSSSVAPVAQAPVAPVAHTPVVPVAQASVQAQAPVNTRTDDRHMTLVEESLSVGKETRQTGEVEVSKHVVEEQVQVPVTLRHEEVVVTRHAVDRPVAAGETAIGQSEAIRVPVHEEVAQVTKEVRVAEEIEIEKRAVSQQEMVSDTVRREVVDVEQPTRTGTSNISGTSGTLGTGADLTPGNNVPGVQTGGRNADGSPDTRGLAEKAADAVTGDRTDDKTGKRI